MKVLRKFEEAMQYIPEHQKVAGENTLRYIFDKLHHNCYLVVITNGKSEVFKLASSTTAPQFKEKINKTLKSKRGSKLKTLRNKELRVMMCVVKPFKEEETTSGPYARFLDQLPKLPDGAFILNITDAVLLRKDRKEPWPMSSGDKSIGQYADKPFLPILGGSGKEGYDDIPVPNYDDVMAILGDIEIPNYNTDWNSKKGVAVFRGGPTGCGTTPETNQRLKLATMKSDLLDVGINKYSSLAKFDPKYGLSVMERDIPLVKSMSEEEQSNYKYIIHVDGNVAAFRLLRMMLSGSVILKVDGEYKLWFEDKLKEGTHYLPVKKDLSDLEDVVQWATEHDDRCKRIAERARKMAEKLLTKEYINKFFVKTLKKIL